MPGPAENAQIIRTILEKFAKEKGLPQSFVRYSLAIAANESGYYSDALNDGSKFGTNEYSLGPWQINLKAHPNVTREQAMDPVFSTNHRLESLLSAWSRLGGESGIARMGSDEFFSEYHRIAQVSYKPDPSASRRSLTTADSVLGTRPPGPGQAVGPAEEWKPDPVVVKLYDETRATYEKDSAALAELKARRDATTNEKERDALSFEIASREDSLAVTRDTLLQLFSATLPPKGDTPSTRAAAETDRINSYNNWVKIQYDQIRGMFDSRVAIGNLMLQILNSNNDIAQREYDNFFKAEQIDQQYLGLALEARAKQQAEQIALLGLRLQQAEFISKQEAWNAVHLFTVAENPDGKVYQPGFGPNDAMAQAGRLLGINAPVIEAAPVDPSRFDPVNMLQRSGETLPEAHSDEWWGVTELLNRVNKPVPSPAVGTRIDPSAVLPAAPDYGSITNPYFTTDGTTPVLETEEQVKARKAKEAEEARKREQANRQQIPSNVNMQGGRY